MDDDFSCLGDSVWPFSLGQFITEDEEATNTIEINPEIATDIAQCSRCVKKAAHSFISSIKHTVDDFIQWRS